MAHSEKDGGRPRANNLMEDFRKALQDNSLSDMGWKGVKYTLSNKHFDETFTKERLDTFVAKLAWIDLFKNRLVEVLTARKSNHLPILLQVVDDNLRRKGQV